MKEYLTNEEVYLSVGERAIRGYTQWLGDHITYKDPLTRVIYVAVNKHTQKPIPMGALVGKVQFSGDYEWREAFRVYWELHGRCDT